MNPTIRQFGLRRDLDANFQFFNFFRRQAGEDGAFDRRVLGVFFGIFSKQLPHCCKTSVAVDDNAARSDPERLCLLAVLKNF